MQQPEPGKDQENVSSWLVDAPEGSAGRASLGAPSPLLSSPQALSPGLYNHAMTPLAERQHSSVPGHPLGNASPKSKHFCTHPQSHALANQWKGHSIQQCTCGVQTMASELQQHERLACLMMLCLVVLSPSCIQPASWHALQLPALHSHNELCGHITVCLSGNICTAVPIKKIYGKMHPDLRIP